MTAMNPVESKVSLKDTPCLLKSRRPMRGAEAGEETTNRRDLALACEPASPFGFFFWFFCFIEMYFSNNHFRRDSSSGVSPQS